MNVSVGFLVGERTVLERGGVGFPEALGRIPNPPEKLYVVGSASALKEGLAVVGARKATPYGKGCATRFAGLAARKGVAVISGGARGCDAAAHEAALSEGGVTVAFLGGGCDNVYPPEHLGLFQRIVDAGGAVASEQPWSMPPLPYMFRARNRLIAALAKATLIVEAGLPSGTFSTADEALSASREVWVVPGSITARSSRGANRLIRQGATPIVDDDSFEDELFATFGCLKTPPGGEGSAADRSPIVAMVQQQAMGLDELMAHARRLHPGPDARRWLFAELARGEMEGLIERCPAGGYGPAGGAGA